jgi:hypothetical protein
VTTMVAGSAREPRSASARNLGRKDPPVPAPDSISISRSRSTADRSTRCRSWPTVARRSTAQPLHATLRRRRPPPSPFRVAGRPDGGGAFRLPAPGRPGQNSLHNPPLPIPAKIKKLYVAAAAKYKIPWTLLAGIGMEETGHGRNNHTSSAGAQGLMQFMPGTFASMGVDGDGDGRADIHNAADRHCPACASRSGCLPSWRARFPPRLR